MCLDYSKAVKNAKDDIARLRREVIALQNAANSVDKLLIGPSGERLKTSQQLRSTVRDSQSHLQAVARGMTRFGLRALKWPFRCKEVETIVQDLGRCTQAINLALQVDQTYVTPTNAKLTRLKKVLLSQARGQVLQLGATYLSVLNSMIAGVLADQQEGIIQEFRTIVGAIVVLGSPLSTSALARILDVSRDDVEGRLEMLHSVLSIPSSPEKPVRLLHLSFRDFLLDPTQQAGNAFCFDEKQAHQAMAANYICDIKAPGTPRSVIDPRKIEACLPQEVRYACLYWVYHLKNAGMPGFLCKQVHCFLKSHFLHWLESLSLLGRLRESVHLIDALKQLTRSVMRYIMKGYGQLNPKVQYLSALIDDAMRLVLAHSSAIENTPLQIYSSLLIFSPKRSTIRNEFACKIPDWISL
ncbi:Vegetative incompatibility protein HET-E-1 [Tolypocladium capitatum]|uniref:Vegetative incompatibility protein HET-E-1 n=1 Tax=Tolypocladium capitatum TaxID=45235 RepID=A0A2K3Q155_9HYPO|nr:Vegetative incompatibility protein HET-E-1 [Tolypocladium capitatum]